MAEWSGVGGEGNDVNHFLVWDVGVGDYKNKFGMEGKGQSWRRGEVEWEDGCGGEAGG